MSFLDDILEATRHAIDDRERELPLEQLKAETQPRHDDRRFLRALDGDGIAVIAEFKRRAPSSKLEHLDASVTDCVKDYVDGGASALSILTESSQFGGSLEDLKLAREAVKLPILRKDFVIDERQVYEAVNVGADAILLIAAVLRDDRELADLYRLARDLGLDVLLEVRNLEELHRALRLEVDLIGINNRNLETLQIDVDTTRRLVDEITSGATIVSESGLKTRRELDDLAEIGVHAILIGSALMDAPDRKVKCQELTLPAELSARLTPSDHPAVAA